MKFNTKNIFLDANIYEENNFFHGTNIQSIFYYSRIKVVNLYMTSISYLELINRMEKKLIEIKEEHNKLVNSLNKKNRILRNLSEYSDIQKSTLNVEKSIIELTKKLDTNIKSSNIKIIPTENIIDDVFKLYYKNESPFSHLESKKHEFPDAFIVKAIDSWCKKNNEKIIFITKDEDFSSFKSKYIVFSNSLPNLLDEITKHYDSLKDKQLLPKIAETLKRNQVQILDLIDAEIDPIVLFELDYERTSELELGTPKFKFYNVTFTRPDFAEVNYNVEIDYHFTIFPSTADLEKEIFEDDVKPFKVVGKLSLPCELEVNLSSINDIKLKRINSNQKIRINNE